MNGKQMTVCWHVDDLKVSHVDDEELTKFGQWLNETYGVSVVSHRGEVHDYLGMVMDYSAEGKVKVTMIDYIKRTISDFPEEIVSNKTTPAADWLFDVRPEGEAATLPRNRPWLSTTQWRSCYSCATGPDGTSRRRCRS